MAPFVGLDRLARDPLSHTLETLRFLTEWGTNSCFPPHDCMALGSVSPPKSSLWPRGDRAGRATG